MTSADGRAQPLSNMLLAEWTKLRSAPSSLWLLAAMVAGTVGLAMVLSASVETESCAASSCDTVKLTLSGVYFGQSCVAALAVLAITGEYRSGLIGTTLTVEPRRMRVFIAKAAVATAAIVGVGLIAVAGSLLVNSFVPARGYPSISVTDGATLRAAGGTVLYFGLIGLLSLGIGTALRDTAWALTAVLALLYVSPILVQFVTDPTWRERIEQVTPMNAGLAVQTTTNVAALPIQPWLGLAVTAGYAVVAMVAGAVVLTRRDA